MPPCELPAEASVKPGKPDLHSASFDHSAHWLCVACFYYGLVILCTLVFLSVALTYLQEKWNVNIEKRSNGAKFCGTALTSSPIG